MMLRKSRRYDSAHLNVKKGGKAAKGGKADGKKGKKWASSDLWINNLEISKSDFKHRMKIPESLGQFEQSLSMYADQIWQVYSET